MALSFNHTNSTLVNNGMGLALQVLGVGTIFVQGPFNGVERVVI
jgi:hypothetical protein